MAYLKNTWVDRVAIGDNKFTDQNGNSYEFTPDPDSVSVAGTPFSAAWMNNIEDGILGAMRTALLQQQTDLYGNENLNNLTVGAYSNNGPITSFSNLPSIPNDVTHFWVYVSGDGLFPYNIAFSQMLIAFDSSDNLYVYGRSRQSSGDPWGTWQELYAPFQENVYVMVSGWTANTSGKNYVSRQGKRCILTVSAKYSSAMSPSTGTTLTTLDVKYRPKYTAYGILYGYHSSSPTIDRVTVNTDGTVEIQGTTAANTSITGMVVYDAADS